MRGAVVRGVIRRRQRRESFETRFSVTAAARKDGRLENNN